MLRTLYYVGALVRGAGRFIDTVGLYTQNNTGRVEKLLKHRRLIGFSDKKPNLRSRTVFVAPNASVVGDVTVGENSTIWYNAVVRGDIHQVSIGAFCSIGEGSILYSSPDDVHGATIISDNVVIEPGVIASSVIVQQNATIQAKSIIGAGTIIGKNSIITAGSYVPNETQIPSGQLWGGSPVAFIRDLTPEEIEIQQSKVAEKKALSRLHEVEHLKTPDELLADQEDRRYAHDFVDNAKF